MKALLARTLLAAALAVATAAEAVPSLVATGPMCQTCAQPVSWSGIAAPSGTDWIGLFVPGAPNTSYSAWRYTTGTASGTANFTIPGGAAFGVYEMRLFSNNGYTLLATSNTFNIAPTVSGSVTNGGTGLVGVTISLNGTACTATVAAGAWGCFSTVGWSGTVTASMGGYLFTPASRTVSNQTTNVGSLNFATSAAFGISGTVTAGGSPLVGVAVSASNGGSCTVTNASGQYACAVPTPSWSGTVTPTRSGYTFSPASRSYTSVAANQSAQDYSGAVTIEVSGTVTSAGSPLSGVGFAASNGGSCNASNASGQYTCSIPQGWSGTVTPSLAQTTFSPPSRTYTSVSASQSAQNYTTVFALSGTLTLNGIALPGVTLSATNGVTCTSTNTSGQYGCTAPSGWSGSVTPSATGYSFSPATRNYTSLSADQLSESFTAAIESETAPLYFVHVDHLNTPRAIYDDQQQLRWRWEQQEPFGNTVPDENPSGFGILDFPSRFDGTYADNETNLLYNMNRYLDPALGRYTQFDLIGLKGGINGYVHVYAEPLTDSDPSGLGGTTPAPGQVVEDPGWGSRAPGGRLPPEAYGAPKRVLPPPQPAVVSPITACIASTVFIVVAPRNFFQASDPCKFGDLCPKPRMLIQIGPRP